MRGETVSTRRRSSLFFSSHGCGASAKMAFARALTRTSGGQRMGNHAPTIGFIGLGVMGGPMCRNVGRKHSAPVHAFDVNPSAMRDVGEGGVRPARSIAEVAAASDVIFLSLPGGRQVEAVCFGQDGIAAAGRRGSIVVD